MNCINTIEFGNNRMEIGNIKYWFDSCK